MAKSLKCKKKIYFRFKFILCGTAESYREWEENVGTMLISLKPRLPSEFGFYKNKRKFVTFILYKHDGMRTKFR